ncbi:MAG: hypothetical protein ACUVQY_10710 [Thermoproteota archaeon]
MISNMLHVLSEAEEICRSVKVALGFKQNHEMVQGISAKLGYGM